MYPKAIFDAVRLVRVATVSVESNGGGMVWGSMQTAMLLEDYAKYNFVDHPKVSAMLALSAMRKEGLSVLKLTADYNRLHGQGQAWERRLKAVEARPART